MVRTTTKRKSESALPPPKHHKSEQSFSLSPSPEPERSIDGLFVQDAPVAAKHVKKRTRKSEPAPKSKGDEEYDEDVGRTESQSFLALVEFESKKKRRANKDNSAYMEKFEKSVYDQEGKLKWALAEAEKKSTKRDTEFLESFKTAYGASRAHGTMPDQANGQDASSGPAPDFAVMYKKTKEITATAFALVAKFEEVAQRIESIDITALIENEWGEQDAIMADLLQEGKQIGIEKYRRILAGSKNDKEEIPEDGDTSNGDFFFDRGEGKANGIWGKVAKKQAKALKKLVKTLEVQVEVA